VFVVHHPDHLIPRNLERRAVVHRCGTGQAQPNHAGQRLLSNKVAVGELRDGGLFTGL
jgi:hypothetical protein